MRKVASFLGGLAIVLAAAGCNGYSKEDFTTTLSGANEVPPTAETATGTFAITFNGPVAEWSLTIAGGGLAAVSASHIHEAAPGVNGGIMVFLYDGPSATITSLKGSFIADQVTACGATCVTNRSFAGIQADVETHNAYVNVHTATYPGGAIRGNF